jgi:hypothetical protein
MAVKNFMSDIAIRTEHLSKVCRLGVINAAGLAY